MVIIFQVIILKNDSVIHLGSPSPEIIRFITPTIPSPLVGEGTRSRRLRWGEGLPSPSFAGEGVLVVETRTLNYFCRFLCQYIFQNIFSVAMKKFKNMTLQTFAWS